MVKEAYCSYELTKLMVNKGFDPDLVKGTKISHQFAMSWLREEHKIFIEIGASIDLNGNYHFSYAILDKECKYVRRGYTSFLTYEDAVEEALKYCLKKLI